MTTRSPVVIDTLKGLAVKQLESALSLPAPRLQANATLVSRSNHHNRSSAP